MPARPKPPIFRTEDDSRACLLVHHPDCLRIPGVSWFLVGSKVLGVPQVLGVRIDLRESAPHPLQILDCNGIHLAGKNTPPKCVVYAVMSFFHAWERDLWGRIMRALASRNDLHVRMSFILDKNLWTQ